MTPEEAWIVNERIKLWQQDEQQWWQRLLRQRPEEARVVAELVLRLNAAPATL